MSDQPRQGQPSSSAGYEESCGVCGGDRRIGNSFGLTTTCPSCHGSGRRVVTTGFHDVTKTKPSHYRQATPAAGGRGGLVQAAPAVPQWPTTFEGGQLAIAVRDSATCTVATKAKLIREIIDYEDSHGSCTQTFIKKVRKQVRPASAT